ncbi:MAG TPA: nucleoside hydrolase [Bacillota bacterium]
MPVVLDTDPGIDDALALLYLLALDRFDLKAVTVVAGNVPLSTGLANARGLLELVGLQREVPVYAGCPQPLLRPLRSAEHFHGPGGLGFGRVTLPEPTVPVRDEHAVWAVHRLSREYTGELTIIAVGPLTNVAAALVLDPDLARWARLVFMGGAAGVPGNVTPAAEFNIHVDPEAARRVVESGMPYTMVGLDVTDRTRLGPSQLAELEGPGPVPAVITGLLRDYLEAYRRLGREAEAGCALHDPLAVGVAADPEFVRLERGRVEVVTDGQEAGRTLFFPEGPDQAAGQVAVELGAKDFVGHFVDTLRARYG